MWHGQVYSKMLPTEIISVVITTYNRSDALLCVLRALECQTDQSFEVVVADDGSGKEHVLAMESAFACSALRLTHVWHPDVGFTASQVRNLGVAQTAGRYIILLDGDCVPDVDFVARHRILAEQSCFVNGSRVLLGAQFTTSVLRDSISLTGRSWWFWLCQRLYGNCSKWTGLMRLPDAWFRKKSVFIWKGIRSCNMSLWKNDYIRINGFDQTFVGWGHEDADFVLRMHNAGLVRKNGFFSTEVYHLWHPKSNRMFEGNNAELVKERVLKKTIQAQIGYLESFNSNDVYVRRWR